MGTTAVRIAAAIVLLGTLSVGGCAQNSHRTSATGPISPGGMRLTVRNPLQGNWICRGGACTCKPLACAAESRVSYSTAPTLARSPDPKALEKFAKVDMPKRIMAANAAQGVLSDGKDKFQMISSKVSNHLGYPSVVSETKFIKGTVATFIVTTVIFAGPSMVSVHSFSPDRSVATKSLNEFIQAITIEEGPPVNSHVPTNSNVPPPVETPSGPEPVEAQSKV